MNLKEEAEANEFAMNLLMPKDFIITEINKLKKNKKIYQEQELINILSRTFKVNETTMRTRLINLGILGG